MSGDLDWSNVHDDATFAYDDFLSRMYASMEKQETVNLEHLRYRQRIEVIAHGYTADIDCLRIIDTILLTRLVTTLCEGCLDRTGCDMCNPPMPPDDFDYDTAHYERFGRPAFPNEY